MTNEEYLDSIGSGGSNRQRCLEAMAKYGDNHWWEPGVDDRTYAYYQIKEPVQLDGAGNQGRLGRGLMALLNRVVFPWELDFNEAALIQEVERAWRWRIGCTSNAERKERVSAAVRSVTSALAERGIPTIVISVDEL